MPTINPKEDGMRKPKGSAEATRGASPRVNGWLVGQSKKDVDALVCQHFCEGKKATEIAKLLHDKYGKSVKRTSIYPILQKCAKKKWLLFSPGSLDMLSMQIRQIYPLLGEISVVQTTREQVTTRGAEMLFNMIRAKHAVLRKPAVHVGFSGGYSMREVARRLGDLLRMQGGGLPEVIVFHSLGGAFDVDEPTTDPNSFFAYLVQDSDMKVKTEFVGLRAPTVVGSEEIEKIKKWKGITEAYARAGELDIVVTSAARWDDHDSMFYQYMQDSPDCCKKLDEAGCVGDMFWQPLGDDGPIDAVTSIRTMTILELRDVQQLIKDKNLDVLLVIAPCGKCGLPKTPVLKAALSMEQPLVTHLVVDSRTASELVGSRPSV
jgi:DNA-binding transcriptional regulator LsrR (DeoR family)